MQMLFEMHSVSAPLGASAVAWLCAVLFATPATAAETKWPAIGDTAPDFELATAAGETMKLSRLTDQGPVVLMVLRGYPGYQCPICTRQVGEFIRAADKFRDAEATVVMVYPGPAEELSQRAEEFSAAKNLPDGFHLLIDPDYKFTNAYNLRWDAPRETAYPATFVMDEDRKVIFAKVSQTHAGRASASQVVEALRKLKPR